MPTKANKSGKQQPYVPSGNGDASGEYANNESGSNKNFVNFSKPKDEKKKYLENGDNADFDEEQYHLLYSAYDNNITKLSFDNTTQDLVDLMKQELKGNEYDVNDLDIERYLNKYHDAYLFEDKLQDNEDFKLDLFYKDDDYQGRFKSASSNTNREFSKGQVSYLYALTKQGKININRDTFEKLYDYAKYNHYDHPYTTYGNENNLVNGVLNYVKENNLERAQDLINAYENPKQYDKDYIERKNKEWKFAKSFKKPEK